MKEGLALMILLQQKFIGQVLPQLYGLLKKKLNGK